jgi:holliday junction DNA helicase RuvA
MITKLTGLLDSTDTDHIVIDVQGVGYYVHTSRKTIDSLPDVGQKMTLYIEHIIREDSQMLCGFINEMERAWFRILLTVQGVGVRVALAIMSTLSIDDLSEAILTQNKHTLTRADGVGPKVASRIVLELKGKEPTGYKLNLTTQQTIGTSQSTIAQDAISALISLGYNKNEASSAVAETVKLSGSLPVDQLIRASLQKLSKVA